MADPKIIGRLIIELDEKGEEHFTLPTNKELTVNMLLDGLKFAAFMPNKVESRIIAPILDIDKNFKQKVS
jgi:hypothetical protein